MTASVWYSVNRAVRSASQHVEQGECAEGETLLFGEIMFEVEHTQVKTTIFSVDSITWKQHTENQNGVTLFEFSIRPFFEQLKTYRYEGKNKTELSWVNKARLRALFALIQCSINFRIRWRVSPERCRCGLT